MPHVMLSMRADSMSDSRAPLCTSAPPAVSPIALACIVDGPDVRTAPVPFEPCCTRGQALRRRFSTPDAWGQYTPKNTPKAGGDGGVQTPAPQAARKSSDIRHRRRSFNPGGLPLRVLAHSAFLQPPGHPRHPPDRERRLGFQVRPEPFQLLLIDIHGVLFAGAIQKFTPLKLVPHTG